MLALTKAEYFIGSKCYTLRLSHVSEQAPCRDIRHWLACFACYTLRFGYKNKQACFCIQTLCAFHVKHLEPRAIPWVFSYMKSFPAFKSTIHINRWMYLGRISWINVEESSSGVKVSSCSIMSLMTGGRAPKRFFTSSAVYCR